ncbi:hypothetical protein G6F23_015823 [Rhizopus arrhizus]|nr:hypothetical protein G6F23_015823 [Rhizopus arrhizus]
MWPLPVSAFIEAGYRFGSAEGGLEPYLQVARVEVDLKQIDERGGAAALHGKVDDTGTTVATAGVRFDKGLKASFQQDSWSSEERTSDLPSP